MLECPAIDASPIGSDNSNMTLSLSESTVRRVNEAVSEGRIASPDAFLNDALDRLDSADATIALLRERVAQAARGDAVRTTLEQIKADGRKLAGLMARAASVFCGSHFAESLP